MHEPHLDTADVALLRRCMDFIAHTPALDGAFATRLGVDPSEFAKMLLRWPEGIENTESTPTTTGIHNALNEIVNGLHLSGSDLRQIGASRGAVQALWSRWATVRGLTPGDLR